MIYTVTLNPALDKTVEIPNFTIGNVNRITQIRTDPGGKGINVSKVIQALGGESLALGILGGSTGSTIHEALTEMGLRCDFLFAPGQTRTNLKVVDPAGRTNTDINEPGFPVTEELLNTLLEKLTRNLKPDDIVILSGSLPKGAAPDTYRKWAASCAAAGAKVFLDADGEALKEGLKAKPFLVKPNDRELSQLLGKTLTSPEDLCLGAKQLLSMGISQVVISMGSRGALYVTKEKTLYAEGLSVPVGSTVGAGDSVVAALAVARSRGYTPEEAAILSTATGAANVMCSGTQAASLSSVEKLMPSVVLRSL